MSIVNAFVTELGKHVYSQLMGCHVSDKPETTGPVPMN